MSATYPAPKFRRPALLPALLGGVACLAGVAAIGGDVFLVIRFVVAIVAAIVAVIAVQSRRWWWAIPMAAIVVLWNPVLPIELGDDVWRLAHYVGALVFILTAVLLRVRVVDADRPRNA
jgi:hypothetical protein